jgi:hypothetical protein
MHEETLDHILVCELAATPPTFFAPERVSVAVETHWLGSRRMYGRWEIADIALFVILRRGGSLLLRKVALLQTKRLYSDELAGTELEDADYRIGVGRLVDRIEATVPLTKQRAFGFKETSVYGALLAGSEQVQHIDSYMETRQIPVYYGLYNPPNLPFSGRYPATSTATAQAQHGRLSALARLCLNNMPYCSDSISDWHSPFYDGEGQCDPGS